MTRTRQLLRDNWAGPVSVLMHGAVLAAVVLTLHPVAISVGEKAVPVTLVNLVPPAPPPPAPVVEPPPLPPPIATTAPEAEETAPPPKKPRPKRETPKPVPPPQVTSVAPPSPPAPHSSETPLQKPQAAEPPPAYLSLLFSKLERSKVYPHSARIRREQGTALLRFVVDRDGRVLTHRIDRSTGHGDLDREVEAMLVRAQPLPHMPAEMTQAEIEVVVPVQFYLR